MIRAPQGVAAWRRAFIVIVPDRINFDRTGRRKQKTPADRVMQQGRPAAISGEPCDRVQQSFSI